MLSKITPYVYGTTRLGNDSIAIDKRVGTALAAMESGVWFHTSNQYGSALSVLRQAFDLDRSKVPKLIIKLEAANMDDFRADIQKNIVPLGIDHIDVGQLCLRGRLAEEFAAGGSCYKQFQKMKADGLVNAFVLEIFPWTSNIAMQAWQAGYSKEILDAHILYINPLQRFASNALWDILQTGTLPIISMRTVAGGPVHKLRDVPGFAWKKYLQERAAEVAPIFEKSGIKNWTEFCLRFALNIPRVIATVGATGNKKNLDEFLAARQNLDPLPAEIMREITGLHYRWSDALDLRAEPWTM